MKRNRRVDVRLTDEELSDIKYNADRKGMSISDYIRDTVKGTASDIDKRKVAMHIFNMQTFLNNIYHQGMCKDSYDAMEKEMNMLWQFLN